MDDLLPIGRFSRVSGLNIGALRHYDEMNLLRPAVVDRDTGYRRYRAEQLSTARLIARLRDLEVPLDEIRRILAADEAERRGLLAAHRARLEARAFRVHYLLHVLGQLSTGKEHIVTAPPRPRSWTQTRAERSERASITTPGRCSRRRTGRLTRTTR